MSERALPPTDERLRRARAEGSVAHSPRASTAVALLAAAALLPWAAGSVQRRFTEALRAAARAASGELTVRSWGDALAAAGADVLRGVTAVVAAATVAHLLVSGAQTRFLFAWPKRSSGRRHGREAVVALAWGAALLAVGAWSAWSLAHTHGLVVRTPEALVTSWRGILAGVVLRTLAAAAALGVLDAVYRWWQHRRELRMTRDEMRREQRDAEGDPMMRARRRELHREHASSDEGS